MIYKRCGQSSIHLPQLSLDLGGRLHEGTPIIHPNKILYTALELGICSWDISSDDIATFQKSEDLLKDFLQERGKRDDLFLASGISPRNRPFYRSNGRKGIRQELDRLLPELGCDYLDLFYLSDPFQDGAAEEAAATLACEINRGRILYAGLSGFTTSDTQKWMDCLQDAGVSTLLVKHPYSPAQRLVEQTLDHLLEMTHTGLCASSPFLLEEKDKAAFETLAKKRNQSTLQLILSWLFRQNYVNSVLLPFLAPAELENCAQWLNQAEISTGELADLG